MSTTDTPHSSTSQSLWMGSRRSGTNYHFFQSCPDFTIFGMALNLAGPQ